MRLPNGRTVLQVNPDETSLQYRDIVLSRAYLQHGIAVEAGATVVDVGANIGISCLFFHWEAPDVRVIAFEPVPELVEPLRANLAGHGVDATVLPFALGRTNGRATLTYYPRVNVMTTMYPDAAHDAGVTRTFLLNSGFEPHDVEELLTGRHESEELSCVVRTLSDVVAELAIDRIDLLKINVEKAEQDVLDGISGRDWPKVRQITMQVHDVDGRVRSLEDELTARGFAVVAAQDPLLEGTDIFDLYARRPG